MSMRITQLMLSSRALRDIRSSTRGRLLLQRQIATGKRVGVPSDDPVAALRILPLRNQILGLNQLGENVALAREILDQGAAALDDGSQLMQRLRELVVQGGNGTLSDSDRRTLSGEVDQLLKQMVSIANTERTGSHLFGGTNTRQTPFEIVEGPGGTTVRYRGNGNSTGIEVSPGVRTDLYIPGDQIFQARSRGATTFKGKTGAKPSGASDSGIGSDTLQITFAGLSIPGSISGIAQGSGKTTALGPLSYVYQTGSPPTLSINGGPAVSITGGDQSFQVGSGGQTVSLNVTTPISPPTGTITSQANLSTDGGASTVLVSNFSQEVQVTNSFDNTVLNVDVSSLVRTGNEQVTYTGTFDVFTVLIEARDLLKNDAGLPASEVQSRLSGLLDEVGRAHENILDGVRDLGLRSDSMEVMRNRLEGLKVSQTESLSRIQDTDLSSAILQANQQDFAFQASLAISSRILQTSLLNFLR